MAPHKVTLAVMLVTLTTSCIATAQTLSGYNVRRSGSETATRRVSAEAEGAAAATAQRISSAAEAGRARNAGNSAVAEQAANSAAREEANSVIAEWQTALSRAIDDPAGFEAVLSEHLRNPDQPLPNTPLGQAAGIAQIAANERGYGTVLAKVPNDQWPQMEAVRKQLKKKFDDVAKTVGSETQVFVTADGNFRGAANSGGEGAPVGTGSLSITALTSVANLKAAIAIASTQDTVRDGFGAAMLAPANGRALTSGLIDARLVRFLPVHLYGSVSRSLWQVHDTPNVRTASTTILGMGALFYHSFAQAKVQDTSLQLLGEAGLAVRFLGGDLMAEGDSVRMNVLHTAETAFWGPEFGMQIQVGKMTGALQLYYMPHKNDERISGFSGLQLVAGIGVTGDLFGTRE